MLLRRVIAHVRKQEWTAVALDFVIVVAGVVIGIQVSNWNAARVDADVERTLMVSLQRDFEMITEADLERYERTLAAPDDLAHLIIAVRRGVEPEPAVVWAGLEAAMTGYAGTRASPTYDELLATGRLSRLTNADLRRRLYEFQRSREFEAEVTAMASRIGAGAALYEHVDIDPFNLGSDLAGVYRWEGVAQTGPLLQELLQPVQVKAYWRSQSREHAEAILAMIEADLQD
jgi:hypothetical protein